LFLAENGATQRFAELTMGNSWYSPGGAFRLALHATDGNMVLQIVDDSSLPWWQQGQQMDPMRINWIPVWSAKTNGKSVTEADMHLDGNLVVYAGATAVFNSHTNGQEHSTLRVREDGNLVIYNSSGNAEYATNSIAREGSGTQYVTLP
jgi:hypothetical protein